MGIRHFFCVIAPLLFICCGTTRARLVVHADRVAIREGETAVLRGRIQGDVSGADGLRVVNWRLLDHQGAELDYHLGPRTNVRVGEDCKIASDGSFAMTLACPKLQVATGEMIFSLDGVPTAGRYMVTVGGGGLGSFCAGSHSVKLRITYGMYDGKWVEEYAQAMSSAVFSDDSKANSRLAELAKTDPRKTWKTLISNAFVLEVIGAE